MVRVNLIEPRLLTDNHLRAEWVELQILVKYMEAHQTGFIPANYCLGKGHISFFRDKALFVAYRIEIVLREMESRGYNINYETYTEIGNILYSLPASNCNGYIPTQEDINLSLSRILERVRSPLKLKRLHKYYGNPITYEEYLKFVKGELK